MIDYFDPTKLDGYDELAVVAPHGLADYKKAGWEPIAVVYRAEQLRLYRDEYVPAPISNGYQPQGSMQPHGHDVPVANPHILMGRRAKEKGLEERERAATAKAVELTREHAILKRENEGLRQQVKELKESNSGLSGAREEYRKRLVEMEAHIATVRKAVGELRFKEIVDGGIPCFECGEPGVGRNPDGSMYCPHKERR